MFRTGRVAVAGISTAAIANILKRSMLSYCEQRQQSELSSNDDIEKKTLPTAVVISLSSQSRQNLKEYLEMNKFQGAQGNYVIINKGLTQSDLYQYEPIFGERTAFRLKGIIQSSNKSLAGFGRVAIMSGEIRDETLVASLPFQLETNDFSKETHLSSIQLPSEVSNVLINSDKSHSEDVQLVHHKNGNESITISYFPKMHQIVLEGRLCRADMIDADGNCTFDRSQIKLGDESNLDDLSEIPSESAVIISEDKYAINDETEKDECPVCRYMKAGPCKSEFIKWDECVTKIDGDEAAKACFPQTVEMMTCFKNFEYYDIMTAGTRPHLYKQSTEVVDN